METQRKLIRTKNYEEIELIFLTSPLEISSNWLGSFRAAV